MKTQPSVSMATTFKAIWQGLKPNRWLFFWSIAGYTAASVLSNIVPIYYKRFFDALGLEDKVIAASVLIGTLYLILAIRGVQWAFYRLANRGFVRTQTSVMARLKQQAFDRMMLHSHNFFANNFTGGLVQKVNRFSRAFERLSDTLAFNLIPLAVTVSIAVAVIWREAPAIAAVMLGWVVVLCVFSFFFARWKQKYDLESVAADSRSTGVLADSITNNSAITLFTSYREEAELYRDVTEEQAKKTRAAWNVGDVVDMVQVLLIYIVEFVVFYYAVAFWQEGRATIGTFVLIQVYVIGLAQQLWGVSRIIRTVYESVADSREMVEIMETPYEIKDLPQAGELAVTEGRIDLENLTFNFNETRTILKDLNLIIQGGEKVAIVGPSGAGKTTFIRLLLRLYEPTSGAIKIDGQDIKRVSQDSLRRHVSLVPQDPVLFHRTLMENIRYGRREATDEEVIRAAKLAHCDEFIDKLPLKYDTYVGERGIKLSGGERQRIAIARAILKDAPVLILDEATSSLDSHSEFLIQDALDTLMKDRTTIVIAHRLSTIRKMDTIIVMDGGTVRERGSHEELLRNEASLYRRMWELQAGGFVAEEDLEAAV